jgi:alpha-N-arabinofuranosidase
MAACAQLVNCLNALFLTHEDKFTVTPNYHVFDLYSAHQGAQAVRAEFSAPTIQYQRDGKPAQFGGLNGSASVNGKTLTLTVTNPSIDTPRETEILVRGGRASSASARILSASDVHAHNTLDHEEIAAPRQVSLQIVSGAITIQLPPASVTSVTIELA